MHEGSYGCAVCWESCRGHKRLMTCVRCPAVRKVCEACFEGLADKVCIQCAGPMSEYQACRSMASGDGVIDVDAEQDAPQDAPDAFELPRGMRNKGLGKGRASRKFVRNNVQGITRSAIRRLARRGGIVRMSGLIYETVEDEEDEEGEEEESRRGSEQEDDEEDEEGDKEESRRASEDRAWKNGRRPQRKRAKCKQVRRGEYSCKECGGRVQMALPPHCKTRWPVSCRLQRATPHSLHDCFCLPHGKRKNVRKECGGKAAQCSSHSQGTSETKRGYVRGKQSFHWQRWATGDKVKVVRNCLSAGFDIKMSDTAQNIMFSFSHRPSEGVVVRNACYRGEWGAEDRSGSMPFAVNQRFVIVIERSSGGFLVTVDDVRNFELDFTQVSLMHGLQVRLRLW